MSELSVGRGQRRLFSAFPARQIHRLGWVALWLGTLVPARLPASDTPYEQEPISYSDPLLDDPVSKLDAELAAGTRALDYEPAHGYLQAVLRALQIPESSQTLVFSKTSFQRDRISPETPPGHLLQRRRLHWLGAGRRGSRGLGGRFAKRGDFLLPVPVP